MDSELHFRFLPTPRADLGESPVWSSAGECVWWVDIPACRVFRTNGSDGTTQSWRAKEMTGIVAPSRDGGAVVGMESGLFHLDPDSDRFEKIAVLDDQGVRFNDAATDATGRLWAATMEFDYRRPVGKLYRVEADCRMTVISTGLWIPNGLAIDAARGRIYLSDSHPDLRTVWVADLVLDSGVIGKWRIFARFDDLPGRPDGAALDSDGNYWIAAVGGSAIHIFSPAGEHLAQYAVPVANPTKIAFGGATLSDLYLTSKSDADSGGQLALARTNTRGGPIALFG